MLFYQEVIRLVPAITDVHVRISRTIIPHAHGEKHLVIPRDMAEQSALPFFKRLWKLGRFPEGRQRSLLKGVLTWFPHVSVRVALRLCICYRA